MSWPFRSKTNVCGMLLLSESNKSVNASGNQADRKYRSEAKPATLIDRQSPSSGPRAPTLSLETICGHSGNMLRQGHTSRYKSRRDFPRCCDNPLLVRQPGPTQSGIGRRCTGALKSSAVFGKTSRLRLFGFCDQHQQAKGRLK